MTPYQKFLMALLVGVYIGILAYVFFDFVEYMKRIRRDIANSRNKRQRENNPDEKGDGRR